MTLYIMKSKVIVENEWSPVLGLALTSCVFMLIIK